MTKLGAQVTKIRSKNAGPFWLTIDLFFEDTENYKNVAKSLSIEQVAVLFKLDAGQIKRFDIEALNVIKFSMPRPHRQGERLDRDMHGASYAALFEELEIPIRLPKPIGNPGL